MKCENDPCLNCQYVPECKSNLCPNCMYVQECRDPIGAVLLSGPPPAKGQFWQQNHGGPIIEILNAGAKWATYQPLYSRVGDMRTISLSELELRYVHRPNITKELT
jgi:hypothetical protein